MSTLDRPPDPPQPTDPGEQQLARLLAALQSPDTTTRCLAAESLGNLGDRQAVEPLIEVVKNLSTDKQGLQAAITALGKLGDPRAVEPLAWRLNFINLDKPIVLALIEALATLNDQRAVQPLMRLLVHDDSDIRQAAQSALTRLGVSSAQIAEVKARIKRLPSRPPGYNRGGSSWRGSLRPSLTAFTDRMEWATWGGVWRLLFGFVGFVLGLLVLTICVQITRLSSGETVDTARLFGVLVGFGLALCVGVAAGFFLSSSLVYLSARLFGGRGSYLKHNYLIASFQIPLACIGLAISTILALFQVPALVADALSILLGVYGIVLLVLALRAAHALSAVKATLAAILPVIVLSVIVVLIALAAAPALQQPTTPA